MRWPCTISFLSAALLLWGCSSEAPRAPIGLNKRPANPPQALAAVRAVSSAPTPGRKLFHARAARSEPGSGASVPPLEPVAPPPPVSLPIVITLSADVTPGGVGALSAIERARLVWMARTASSITLFCRSDHSRPSRATWRALARQGGQLKLYLVAHGVPAARVRIFVRSSGAFVADNATAAGRARNRRIEIHLA